MKLFTLIVLLLFAATAFGQSYIADMARESATSDKLYAGGIEKQQLVPGDPNVRITINVPSLQMTLWQNGREVRTYSVGIGMLEFPVKIGILRASSLEWNPVWIPPSSNWIDKSSTVKPG